MTTKHKKKLIEVAIPLEAINAASIHEKSIRHGHPSTLHLWWARRPLAACRAVLFAQLVDDPSEYAEDLLANAKTRKAAEMELAERLAKREKAKAQGNVIPLEEKPVTLEDVAVDLERKRLFEIIEELAKWENSANDEVIERAREEIRRSFGGALPSVYDPFSGGASIPLEAQRLGLGGYGSDLNPVAALIGKAMVEIPAIFKDMSPIHPGVKERNHYRNAEGLAEDVRYYGEWIHREATSRLSQFYPEIDLPREYGGGKGVVAAWLWARTVPSPDPSLRGLHVPLVRTFEVSTKKGRKIWVDPVVHGNDYHFELRFEEHGDKGPVPEGTVTPTGGRCLVSGSAMPLPYIREKAKSGEMGQRLLAVVAEGTRGRVYLPPNEETEAIALRVPRPDRPEGDLPARALGFRVQEYGMKKWRDLFTARQQAALNTFSDLINEVCQVIEADAKNFGLKGDKESLEDKGTGSKAYADAVGIYLSFAISKVADRGSSICTWFTDRDSTRNTFARQAIPMTWDFAEMNVLLEGTGSFLGAVEWTAKSLAGFHPSSLGRISQADAKELSGELKDHVISTDPPYYDNIGYADLSDFFYVWLRQSLRERLPRLFGVLSTPKMDELVATPYRHGNRIRAEEFFLDGMQKAVAAMAMFGSDMAPATIYYAFKQSEIKDEGISSTGWATFLQAVIGAGFSVVGTWPVRTELSNRMIASGTNALANSVVLVCRKKETTAEVITRAEFIRALKRELPPAIAELQAANIAPADMPQSAIGPGMGVYSRYKAVLESDDSPMTVKTALQLINRELDEYLGGIVGEFDSDTRFALTWFEQNGYNKGEYGTANNIATARGISVDSVKHAGVVESAAGKVRIFKRDELLEDWDPNTDAHLTIWECCQYLIRTLENEGEYAAAILLKKIGPDKADAVKDLAYCLYDICSNKRKDAREATSYNALIAVWTELTRQAASISDIEAGGDRQTAMNF